LIKQIFWNTHQKRAATDAANVISLDELDENFTSYIEGIKNWQRVKTGETFSFVGSIDQFKIEITASQTKTHSFRETFTTYGAVITDLENPKRPPRYVPQSKAEQAFTFLKTGRWPDVRPPVIGYPYNY
jgi:hypothetical protein